MNTPGISALRLSRAERTAAILAAALMSLAACSGGPAGADAPADADVDDFCEIIGDLDVSDPERLIEDLVEVGTPDGAPEEARDGFEVLIDKGDEDENDVSAEDQEKVDTFFGYVLDTCGAFPADDPTPS